MNTVYLKLIKDISKYIPLSKEDIRTISESFSSITIPKNTMLEVENNIQSISILLSMDTFVFFTQKREKNVQHK